MTSLAVSGFQNSQGSSSLRAGNGVGALTPEQRKQVEELRRVDAQVREHEAAHMRSGRGVITSGASFSFTYGPDGKAYAVAGEVGIDTGAEREAQANINKGRAVQAAALAPRDPSSQDYRVAAIGGQLEARGRSDLAAERAEQLATAAGERTTADGERSQATQRVASAYLADAQRPGDRVSLFA